MWISSSYFLWRRRYCQIFKSALVYISAQPLFIFIIIIVSLLMHYYYSYYYYYSFISDSNNRSSSSSTSSSITTITIISSSSTNNISDVSCCFTSMYFTTFSKWLQWKKCFTAFLGYPCHRTFFYHSLNFNEFIFV